jgi:hypothetical protein
VRGVPAMNAICRPTPCCACPQSGVARAPTSEVTRKQRRSMPDDRTGQSLDASASSFTRRAMLAPHSHAIQTTASSTPASRSPHWWWSVKKASSSVRRLTGGVCHAAVVEAGGAPRNSSHTALATSSGSTGFNSVRANFACVTRGTARQCSRGGRHGFTNTTSAEGSGSRAEGPGRCTR